MSSCKSLTFFIPGLNESRLTASLWRQLGDDELSAFNAIFSKAKKSSVNVLTSSFRCFELFQLLASSPANSSPSDTHYLPIAEIFYANVTAKKTRKCWIYNVTPVHLHADMDQLVFAKDLTEQLSEVEAQQICQSINQIFNETAQDKSWELVYYAKNQWFIFSKQPLINQSIPTDSIGKPLLRPCAVDEFSSYWIQTLNEIQMLLFSLAKNKVSTQSSLLCNSLWLWGESYYPSIKQVEGSKWDKVYSDNLLVQQLAQFTQTRCTDRFEFSSILTENPFKNSLIVFNGLETAIKNQDVLAIVEVLKQYEQQYFIPVTKALLSDSLLSLTIISNGEKKYQLNRKNLKSWWRRNKTTGQLLELML